MNTGSNASQSWKAMKVKEILELSERKLISVLKGETGLPERTVVNVALELYKRRVPQKTESANSGNNITMVKIVKNHLPGVEQEAMDIDTTEIEHIAETVVDGKVAEINKKIAMQKGMSYKPTKRGEIDGGTR